MIYTRKFESKVAPHNTATAVLVMQPQGIIGSPKPNEWFQATVKPGDIIVFSYVVDSPPEWNVGYKVLAVVPPDPDKHMIGWVELDPKRFRGEEEIAKHGDAVVRPVKLKK